MADGTNINRLNLSVNVNANNSIKTINKLNSSLTKLSKTINSIGIDKLNLDGIGGGGSGGKSPGSSSLRNTLFDVANLSRVLHLFNRINNGVKSVARATANLVKVGMEYTETLNLWQVAMGQNIDQAEDFVKSMQKAYGLASTTIMQYQATFRNMLNSLGGVSLDTSYQLSEYLMQMALDYSSLYNTTIEKAMADFQSALSGQTRPIRSVSGYDITEDTIYQLYTSLGGKKTESQLNQVEKRLLRILAIFNQMGRSGAIGDLNKTLENTANQLRIIDEKTVELKTWLGIITETLIRPMLPIVSAVLTVLTEVAQTIAKGLGYEAFDGTIAGFEEANQQADELQGKLLSFDKFEALNLASEQDSDTSIDETVLDAMSEYESIMSEVTTTADLLANSIRKMFFDTEGNLQGWVKAIEDVLKRLVEWFNSLYTIDEATGEVDWHLDGVITKLKSIPAVIGLITATLNKGKITTFFEKLFPAKGIEKAIKDDDLSKAIKAVDLSKVKDVDLGKSAGNVNSIAEKLNIKDTKDLRDLSKTVEGLGDTKNSKGLDAVANSVAGVGKATKGIGVGGWVGIILAIVGALIYLYNTNEGVRESIDQLFDALKPVFTILGKFVSELFERIGAWLQGLAPVISVIIDVITVLVQVCLVLISIILAIFEALMKCVQTLEALINPSKWSTLGQNLKDIWTNWEVAELFEGGISGDFEFKADKATPSTPTINNYSTSSVAGTNGITNTSTANATSADKAIMSSTYNALRANTSQSGSGSNLNFDINLDGKKVGEGVAKHVYGENVRAGRTKVSI